MKENNYQTKDITIQYSRILMLVASILLLTELGPLDTTRTSVALLAASRSTEVAESLTGSATTADQNGVGASGLANSELIKSKALTTSLKDASASGVGEAESADRHLGDLKHAGIVGDSGDDNGGLLGLLASKLVHARERDNRAVGAALHETLADLSVEGRAGTTGEELVESHQKCHVGICAVGVLAHMLLLVVTVQLIDCHFFIL